MKVDSLYRDRHYLTPECILHLYKSVIRPCMEYCCHIWAGASSVVLSLLDKVQGRIVNIIDPTLAVNLQPLSHRRKVSSLSLFYKYFNGRCSSELYSLVPPVKTPVRMTRLSKNSHPYSVSISFCKKGFYSSSFFPRTSLQWNPLPSSCFLDSDNLQFFKFSFLFIYLFFYYSTMITKLEQVTRTNIHHQCLQIYTPDMVAASLE